jgi:hypothetical protein
VPLTAFQILVALSKNHPSLLEQDVGDDRVVVALVQDVSPTNLADIDRVLQHVEDDAPAPLPAVAIPKAGGSLVEVYGGLAGLYGAVDYLPGWSGGLYGSAGQLPGSLGELSGSSGDAHGRLGETHGRRVEAG